ncbi:unnamed protein product [Phaedon cochleariae]|uniref:Uncharacterized protein n=1 Tax=Phaedon cochleariae TaxID=80249 RepID=A0A9P0GN25_PHACE|nr:unnamed protein product [Phaedon cochleariae]
MTLVLDVQGFKLEKNKFIVKELAAFDGSKICHYIFKAPFPLDQLSPDLQRQAHWLTENHHCLPWDMGFTPLHLFGKIIMDLTNSSDIIYVKGFEKANYIRQFIKKLVVEFDEQPTLKMTHPKCFNHSKTQCICALSNVFYLYENFIMRCS